MPNDNELFDTKITNKWKPILDLPEAGDIGKKYRNSQLNEHVRNTTALLLENTQKNISETGRQNNFLTEAAPVNNVGAGNIGAFDPVMISMVRRSSPNLMAYDICGVSPMTGPTGLVFAIKSRYTAQAGTEALFNEADVSFSANNAGQNLSGPPTTAGTNGTDPFGANYLPPGVAMSTAQAEALGDGTSGNTIAAMAFDITKITVSAQSRALQAGYTMELAQDYKAIHGGNAEDELANMLSTEILTEQNREIIRNIYYIAKVGAQNNTVTPGTFDLDVDSNGRWSVEKFKGLLFQASREANQIAKQTRRGRGNVIIASSDCADAMAAAGQLDYAPALSTNLDVDDTGNTFVGVLNGKFKVFVDPYFTTAGTDELLLVGYRGANPLDAGFFYCPYVPLEMVRAVDPKTFQPAIAFKTRYGQVENAFYSNTNGTLQSANNPYYRLVKISNIL